MAADEKPGMVAETNRNYQPTASVERFAENLYDLPPQMKWSGEQPRSIYFSEYKIVTYVSC